MIATGGILTLSAALLGGGGMTPAPSAVAAFAPSDVSGLKLWLEADYQVLDGSGAACTDGVGVATWTDRSGTSRNATQSTPTSRPALKTNILNGNPVVRFDGSNDVLAFTTTSLPTFTAFVVFKITAQVAWSGPFTLHNSGEASFSLNSNTGSTSTYAPHITTFNTGGTETNNKVATTTYGTIPMSSFVLQSWTSTPALWINGTGDSLSSGVTGYGTPTGGVIGKGYNASEYVAEDVAAILVYDSALGTTDRQSVESYLRTKYGL